MIVNWSLLKDISDFNANDPDIDQAFIDALMMYYFLPTAEIFEKLLEHIDAKPKGVDVLIALGLRLARERVKNTGIIDKFTKTIMQKYDENESGKTSTTKELYFILLCQLLNIDILDEDKEYYLDISLAQLKGRNANLFCRKEVENFVSKLMYASPLPERIQKLINATIECSTIMALDGITRIFFEAKIIEFIIPQKDNVWKLLNHLKKIEHGEKNICKLAATLIWRCDIGLDIFADFTDHNTKLNTASELMELVATSPSIARKRAVFELLKKEAGKEIDYVLPYVAKVLNEKEITSLLMALRFELPYPRHCSAVALRQYFALANQYLPIDIFPSILDSILPRLRRSPHELLCPEVTRSPGAKTYFTKITSTLVQSSDLTDFDVALDIISFYFDIKDPILIPALDFKTKVLQKIFQDEDQFLSKNAAEYLAKHNPNVLTENAMKIFKARTDRDIRISVMKGISHCLNLGHPAAIPVAERIIYYIYETDDDAEVREAALELCQRIPPFFDLPMITKLFELSVDEWKLRRSHNTQFIGDTKAQLDDLISTMKSKTHDCTECISKECY